MGRHSEERETVSSGTDSVAAPSEPRGSHWGAPEPAEGFSEPLPEWLWEWYGDEETPPRPVVDVPVPDDPEHTALWDFRDAIGGEEGDRATRPQ